MKTQIIGTLIIATIISGCSSNGNVIFKTLTHEKNEKLKASKTVLCEQYIIGTMKYSKIEEIEKRKLNQFKREAKKCGCNTVYLDFKNHTGGADELDNIFIAICVKE
jgi:hypothetical protein